MTRLRIMSDLHLEFGSLALEPLGEDVLVLAGDVGLFTEGAEWAMTYARRTGIRVVMVAGNHEFYRRPSQEHTVHSTIDALRRLAAQEPLFHFLEDDIEVVAGVTFVGATLWTDFDLYHNPGLAMSWSRGRINDFRLIREDADRIFTPVDALRRHEFSAGVLRERLPRRFNDGAPLVVVTHYLPSRRSVHVDYAEDPINAAFASNLDDLVADSGAALWVHGHTHHSFDYQIGDTRVLCNPRGYAPHEVNPEFDTNLVVEVGR